MPFIAFSPSLDRKIPLTGRRLNHRPTVILTGHALFFNKKEAENRQEGISAKGQPSKQAASDGIQLSFFQLDDPVLCQIRDEILNLDVNNLTPLEALNKLNDIKKIVRGR